MMKYGFSAQHKAFYLIQNKDAYQKGGTWSEDIVPISDAMWAEYSCPPKKGKILGADEFNQPCWIDAPAASLSEKQASANEQRISYMVLAEAEINRLKLVACVYKLTLEEEKRLREWQQYFADLYRLSTENPDTISWPEPPQHQN